MRFAPRPPLVFEAGNEPIIIRQDRGTGAVYFWVRYTRDKQDTINHTWVEWARGPDTFVNHGISK